MKGVFCLLPIFLLALIGVVGGATGATLSPAANTDAHPGESSVVSVFLSGADRITVGKFTLTLTAKDGSFPLPTLTAVDAGTAAKSAVTVDCVLCSPASGNDALLTQPTLTAPLTNGTVTAMFLLPSGGAAGTETGGITGDAQEVARFMLAVSEATRIGAVYTVALRDADFSDAASHPVSMTLQTGTLTVTRPEIVLQEGETTTYQDPLHPGNWMVPTSGDDPATTETEPGFPNDGRGVGNRGYRFTVNAQHLDAAGLAWSVTATLPDGSPAPETLKGIITPINGSATQALYLPADAAMTMASSLRLALTARSVTDPSKAVTFHAVMLPYGDADLDGTVTDADYALAFRWANGLDLPQLSEEASPIALTGYVPSPLQRLLADVRPVPGRPTSPPAFDRWVSELARLGLPPPLRADMDRDSFPFGDGRITLSDARWILEKARLYAAPSPSSLDPRVNGTTPDP